MTDVESLSTVSVREAIGLACDIRDIDPAEVWARLDRYDDQHLIRLVTALSALVPVDQPVSQLLAWIGPPPAPSRQVRLHPERRTISVSDQVRRAHNAHNQAKAAGDKPPAWTTAGEIAYQRARYALRVAQRNAVRVGPSGQAAV